LILKLIIFDKSVQKVEIASLKAINSLILHFFTLCISVFHQSRYTFCWQPATRNPQLEA
ncbi:MAG: hypothetical protein ACI9LN_004471, partial [Saprospiraceae bacterium]